MALSILYSLIALAAACGIVYILHGARAALARLSRGAAVMAVLWPLAAGVFLYFCAQSAVERRLLFSLLLPFADGAYLAGRAAMLLACILLCLAAALTERGKRLRARLDAAGDRALWRWVIAAAVTGLFFAWTLRVNVLSYMTNDDVSIMSAIAKIPSKGLSAATGMWTDVLLCAIIGFFYKLAPNGYWYLGYHLAILLISLTIIGRCILMKARRAGHSVYAGCAIHAMLCGAVFSYTFGSISFTVTPAVAGAASIALLLCREEEQSLPRLIAADAVSALLMFFCRLQRKASMRAVICFWAVAAVYALAKLLIERSGGWKKSASVLVCGAALTVFLCFFNFSAELPSTTSDYNSAEYYRSLVMDYMVDDLTPEQWESVGVPQELGQLVSNWFFMDERVNTDTFRQLVEQYYVPGDVQNYGTLSNILGSFYGSRLWITLAMLALTALAAAETVRFGLRRRWPELLCALAAMGGAAVLWVYLIVENRFPLRVFLVVAIPAAVMLVLMDLTAAEKKTETETRGGRALPCIAAVLCAAACVCGFMAAKASPRASYAATRAELFGVQWDTEAYANENPDNKIYTNMTSRNLDPIHSAYTYPNNISLWGGSGVTASSTRTYADAFFRENVRFMYQPASALGALLQYLSLDYGPVQAAVEARLADGVGVVDITQVGPGGDYTGWYEQNGYTYYFENGRAVTGTKVIDGAEYEFMPAGAASFFAPAVDADGNTVYTLDAYSLIGGIEP